MKYPNIISSRAKKEFQFPGYSVSLLDRIKSEGPIEYRFILAVFKGNATLPCFCVTSQTTPRYFLGVFDGDKDFYLRRVADEYPDEEHFTEEALQIFRNNFRFEDSSSEESAESNLDGDDKMDLKISVDGTNLPKVGQRIDHQTIQYAGLAKPGFLGRMMMSKIKTDPSDEIYFKKNCFIQCRRFDDHLSAHEHFGITANTESGNGPMWGNTIAILVGADDTLKKVIIQVVLNRSVAETVLQQFRRLCTKAFGPHTHSREESHLWQDGETSIISTPNGNDAVFHWELIPDDINVKIQAALAELESNTEIEPDYQHRRQ